MKEEDELRQLLLLQELKRLLFLPQQLPKLIMKLGLPPRPKLTLPLVIVLQKNWKFPFVVIPL